MSDLQVILIIIGALIIIGVIVFNWWQERRFYRQVENSFSSLKNDALLDDPKLDLSNLFIPNNDESVNKDVTKFEAELPVQTGQFDALELEEVQLPQKDDSPALVQIIDENFSIVDPSNSAVELLVNSSDTVDKSNDNLSSNNVNTSMHHIDIKSIFSEAFNKSSSIDSPKVSQITAQSSNIPFVITPPIPPSFIENQAIEINEIVNDITSTLPEILQSKIDLTALLYLAEEVPISALSSEFMALSNSYDKTVLIHVLNSEKQWCFLKDMLSKQLLSNQLISKIACSIQLVDRAGAVARNTLNHFQLTVETLGLDINAHVEWQPPTNALEAATELDEFCIDVDKTIGFHLVHGATGPFTGTKLRGLAEAQGLSLDVDGTFKYFDTDSLSGQPDLQPSFVMFNRDENRFSPEMLRTSVVKGVTFQLDIPRVQDCEQAYNHMVQIARQMERGLNAQLVAENNQVLGDVQIEKIRQQLKVIDAKMLSRGIIPGSDTALRLFS